MRSTASRSVQTLVVSLFVLIIAALITTPGVSATARSPRKAQPGDNPAESGCPNRAVPPAPVDTSEEPPPGEERPSPLPVPASPVGGPRMGECGPVFPTGAAEPPAITAASWIIADLDTGEVLAAKDPHARERPASLIKVLLAIVTIRELRPDMVVVGTQEDADQEGTRVGIGPGGEYTVRQLLYALVMHSGNDAAHALARALGGVQVALDKMNSVARELGALDTRAATPSGLDGPGMTTSAYDQSLIFRAAMKHREFAEAAATRQIDFPGYASKPGFKVNNDNRLLLNYPGFVGGKTGFTDDARHTYLGAAKRGEHRLAVVLLRGERAPGPLSDQGAKLLDYGFALLNAGSRPVGELVDRAPEVQPKGEVSSDESAELLPASADSSEPEVAAGRTAFGNVGLPLVALAGVAALITSAMWWRRRRARAARAAADA
ncbi:MAG TPA: D-alanyl-D-alanine carboxypeptidase family protein [Actinophytocola sp.]|uniref:D-alanyl-D-alanine carboxypeptidase family protein n=1 Tax=Actinophytocola sp. TaxID=1872138 RepID=UPI002DB6FD4B|nr:D-alanyl-D-alanine carboxypeptidase family protein [Actinophytocola sp.]HEU5473907.1 D-alanyl-D-alanine carboxypeptidase family protein [Actinophytocola sp.]